MQIKIYASFDEINGELEILKLEKEISYHKLALSFERTRESIELHNIKREIVVYIKEKLSESYKGLLVVAIPYILNFIKRKRG